MYTLSMLLESVSVHIEYVIKYNMSSYSPSFIPQVL